MQTTVDSGLDPSQEPADYLNPGHPGMAGVSPRLAAVRAVVPTAIGVVAAASTIAAAVTATATERWSELWWAVAAGSAGAALALWWLWVAIRQVSALGWTETDTDLVVRHGRLVRSATVIPYGRIQYVRQSQGPVARRLGLTAVHIHTASPGSDATIPGLPIAEAEGLRIRLSDRARERMAGL